MEPACPNALRRHWQPDRNKETLMGITSLLMLLIVGVLSSIPLGGCIP
jgi:hypothetical protein